MPETEYRLDLWRKAISLFYERKKPSWTGPFKAAGYAGVGPQGIKIEPKLMDGEGSAGTPDIVSASSAHWVAIELTADPNKPKKAQLDQYSNLDGSYLVSHGLPFLPGRPVVLIGRPKQPSAHVDEDPYPRMLLGDTFQAAHLQNVSDEALAQALQAFQGQSLVNVPELRFTLLPEQVHKPIEIRKAIAASVLSIFGGASRNRGTDQPEGSTEAADPPQVGVTVKSIVDECLDDLVHAISIDARQRLEAAVEGQMDLLLEKFGLKEFLTKEGRAYKANADVKHPRTLQKLQRLVQNWVRGNGQVPLSHQFGPPTSPKSDA